MRKYVTVKNAILIPALLLGLVLGGCTVFTDAPQTTFDPKGPVAQDLYDLHNFLFLICAGIFLAVASALLYAVVRFRSRGGEDEEPPQQAHGNPIIEVSLIVASVLILVWIAVPTIRSAVYIYDVPPDREGDVIEVVATGYQWWWTFEYPDHGVFTANEMVFPTDTPIRIHLRTDDVIHSFWIPKLAGKVDMIPNRDNFMWLMADEEGEYYGQCAEFCGTSHANMLFRAYAVSEEEFDEWVEHQNAPAVEPEPDTLELTGRQQFASAGCVQCHYIDADGLRGGRDGPDLTHFGSRNTIAAALLPLNEETLFDWLRDPERIKPGNLMTEAVEAQDLTDEEIEALVAYLMSLE